MSKPPVGGRKRTYLPDLQGFAIFLGAFRYTAVFKSNRKFRLNERKKQDNKKHLKYTFIQQFVDKTTLQISKWLVESGSNKKQDKIDINNNIA